MLRKTQILIIPAGIHKEPVRGMLRYLGGKDHVIAVYLDDGMFLERKNEVLRALEEACTILGMEYHKVAIKPPSFDFRELHGKVQEIVALSKDAEILLGATTGPRILLILLMKYLEGLSISWGFRVRILAGIEWTEDVYLMDMVAIATRAKDLGRTQLKILKTLEGGEMSVEDLAKKIGASMWSVYKSMDLLKGSGLVEGRGLYRATIIGRILALTAPENGDRVVSRQITSSGFSRDVY